MLLLSVGIALGLAACSKDGKLLEPANPATPPEQLMENLARAMHTRDEALYETLLDEDFWFVEFDCLGEIAFENDLATELNIIVGSREGSQEGIFDRFRHSFSFDFALKRRYQELGSEYPGAYPGDPNGHPDEAWEVFYGQVQMEMLESAGEGFRVDQNMTFKLRLDPSDGRWKMVRWEDDALTGDCGGVGKKGMEMEEVTWGRIKEVFKAGWP